MSIIYCINKNINLKNNGEKMISSINSTNSMQPPMHMQQANQTMTNEQKESASSILAKYDASNMTEADHESMKAEFEEAGITPSKDLKGMMEDSGFEVPEKPGPQETNRKGRPEPPEFMNELMEKLESGEISEDEIKTFMQNLQNEKGETSGAIMDEYI